MPPPEGNANLYYAQCVVSPPTAPNHFLLPLCKIAVHSDFMYDRDQSWSRLQNHTVCAQTLATQVFITAVIMFGYQAGEGLQNDYITKPTIILAFCGLIMHNVRIEALIFEAPWLVVNKRISRNLIVGIRPFLFLSSENVTHLPTHVPASCSICEDLLFFIVKKQFECHIELWEFVMRILDIM